MATIEFRVRLALRVAPELLWQSLVDWSSHGDWIPSTTVTVHSGDGGAGTEFTATTSVGPLQLPDRMRVQRLVADDYSCEVAKLGPVLTGRAAFKIDNSRTGASLLWEEEVQAARLPAALAPVAGWLGAALFAFAIWRLERQLLRAAVSR